MSGNYPDGLTQASFDEYWNDKLDDPEPADLEDDYWDRVDAAYDELKDEVWA